MIFPHMCKVSMEI